jgi:hypothetical protein
VPLVLAPEWANAHADVEPPMPSADLLVRALTLLQEHAANPAPRGKKRSKAP